MPNNCVFLGDAKCRGRRKERLTTTTDINDTTTTLNRWALDYMIKCHSGKDEFVAQVGSFMCVKIWIVRIRYM